MMKQQLDAGRTDFTAVFAANDLIAAGARRAMLAKGLCIPDDISMVGYDDLSPSADIGLTTVHVPHEELGRTAVRLALQRENNGAAATADQVVLGTHIVVRDSVQPLRREG
jgi:LacI family transcriptional regulator